MPVRASMPPAEILSSVSAVDSPMLEAIAALALKPGRASASCRMSSWLSLPFDEI